MAKFEQAHNYVSMYLGAKRAWLLGNVRAKWFTTAMVDLADGIKLFDPKEEDENARKVYELIKNPKNTVGVTEEFAARLRLHFMVAGTMAFRKQYCCGKDNVYRTALDSYRFEAANAKAARCGLQKMATVIKEMEQAKK